MNFKTFFEAKKPEHFNFNISIIEGPVNLHNGQEFSYKIKVNGKDAIVGPFEKDFIEEPDDIGWDYGNGYLYTPDSYEEMNAALDAVYNALKSWDIKKHLTSNTKETFGGLIDEL